MFKKPLMRAIPLAAALAGALLAGGLAQAQAPAPAPSADMPAGTTKPNDSMNNPAPMAGKSMNSDMHNAKKAHKKAKRRAPATDNPADKNATPPAAGGRK